MGERQQIVNLKVKEYSAELFQDLRRNGERTSSILTKLLASNLVQKTVMDSVAIKNIFNGNLEPPLTKFKTSLIQLSVHGVLSYTGHMLFFFQQ